jgi:hypothetical protein
MTTETDTADKQAPPAQSSQFWQVQLALAEKDHKDFHAEGQEVVERYKSEKKRVAKSDSKRFNILYSNTETLKSALYGRAAKPDVRRRFADKDPVARVAADVVERALIYCAESYDVDKPIEAALHDYLLPGRGVMRIEYEPVIETRPAIDPMTMQPAIGADGQPAVEEYLAHQKLCEKYIYWKDYLQSPSRNWDGVWWIAFRHTMTRDDLEKNKFEDAASIPLNWVPDIEGRKDVPDDLKKAEVWEIWDKSKRQRVWVVKGYPKLLRADDDPYGLETFFPMAEPPVAYADTETAIPRAEFHVYRDQADDLDEITGRISRLTRALKRRGVYDQAVKELKRLARAGDNEFIPVENYASLSQKGGLQAAFQTEDISAIALVLNELYKQRDMLVQGIYEITGVSDILRGSSDPNETLGAQNLKAQFGSQRLKRRQRAIQKWIRDTYKLKAEIIAEHFEPEVLQEMTGQQITPEVMDLLRSDKLRSYRIDIETDSTVFEDAESEKRSTMEMLTAVGGFVGQVVPLMQQAPELAPVAFEMLSLGLRVMKPGRQLEDVMEQVKEAIAQKLSAPPPPPQPDPKQIAEETKAKSVEAKAAHDERMMGMKEQVEEAKHAREMERMAAQATMPQQQTVQ